MNFALCCSSKAGEIRGKETEELDDVTRNNEVEYFLDAVLYESQNRSNPFSGSFSFRVINNSANSIVVVKTLSTESKPKSIPLCGFFYLEVGSN